jgi:hypothetical protein
MPVRASSTKKQVYFHHIDPLRPPPVSGRFGRLAAIVTESATWFFSFPDFDGAGEPAAIESGSLDDLAEAIDVAHHLLREKGVVLQPIVAGQVVPADSRGFLLVDLFCDRYGRREEPFSWKLRSGRGINQRQVLCAMALHQCEQAAVDATKGDARAVCDLMQDLTELICEIRRSLDREAGSTLAARKARQRHAKHYRIRSRACELYDKREWPSARNAARRLFAEVQALSVKEGAPLSEDGGEDTVYRWFREHRKSACARQT